MTNICFVYNPFLSLFYCIILSVRVFTLTSTPRISTGPRVGVASSQITSALQKWLESNNIFKDALDTDIDNHAHTHFFGKNSRPLSWSDLMCSVSPFISKYTTTDNVEICTAATAWTSHTGQVYISVFGQGLWFGDRMDRSLINPNQCRSCDILLCDDPTDPHRPLGFQTTHIKYPPIRGGYNCNNVYTLAISEGARFMSIHLPP